MMSPHGGGDEPTIGSLWSLNPSTDVEPSDDVSVDAEAATEGWDVALRDPTLTETTTADVTPRDVEPREPIPLAAPVPLDPSPPGPNHGWNAAATSTSHLRRRWLIPAVVAAVALIGLAVVAGIAIGDRSHDSHTSPSAAAYPAGVSHASSPAVVSSESVAASSETTTLPPSISTPVPRPTQRTTVGIVNVAEVNTDPRVVSIAQTFDTYFRGINEHDAAAALSVMDPTGVINPNDPAQVQKFADGISTSNATGMSIEHITTQPGGALVALTFRSRQAASLGADGETCTDWQLTYDLRMSPRGYLIHGTPQSAHAAC